MTSIWNGRSRQDGSSSQSRSVRARLRTRHFSRVIEGARAMSSGLVRRMISFLRRLRSGRAAAVASATLRASDPSLAAQPTATLSLALRTRKRYVKIRIMPDGSTSHSVHPSALEPRPSTGAARLELSTFCTESLKESEIWALLQNRTGAGLPQPIFGRGDVRREQIDAAGLILEADWVPERHCNILGWPEAREAQIERQLALSAEMTVFVNPARA